METCSNSTQTEAPSFWNREASILAGSRLSPSIHRIVVLVHRRTQATSDLALADAPSFADVLPQWNSRRDLEAARLEQPAVAQPGAVEHGWCRSSVGWRSEQRTGEREANGIIGCDEEAPQRERRAKQRDVPVEVARACVWR